MAVDRQILENLLNKLQKTLSKLERMEFSPEELNEKVDVQDLVDRRLQVAIECCIDMAAHLASGLNLPGQDTAGEVFKLLAEEKILDRKLSEKLSKACGLRNILVHEYLTINYNLVFQNYKYNLTNLKEFAIAVVDFLEKNPQV